MSRIEQFFSTNFMAPHGFCFMWLPEIVWLHVVADAMIAIAYFSIPLALWKFAKNRQDIPFRSLFLLFASFITLCGLTHVFGILVLWYPAYGLEGLLMLATGLVSALTAIIIWKSLPLALTLPSPKQYQAINEELKEAYHDVEQRVIKRTAELTQLNEDLEIEKQKLAHANELKKQFVANISHEIRTPLNAIVVLSEKFYRDTMPDNKRKQGLESLYNSSIMLKELITDILDFSKIESDSLKIESTSFSLNAIVKDIQTIISVQASDKELYFTIEDNTPQSLKLLGDPLRIKQVLLNLVTNALKFTEEGGVTLTINTRPTEDDINLCIVVKDTGIGINESQQQDIFRQFVQVSPFEKHQQTGTGLGLAISKQLIEKMGGSLTVKSTVGQGSEFSILLPLPIADNTPTTKINSTSEIAVKSNKDTSLRILLVEDTPGNILVASILLDEMGYAFDVAEDGHKAIDMFKNNPYNLVLLDLRLPDMTGYDIAQAMREQDAQQKTTTPIIAMTAFATAEEKQKCFNSGMNDFTTKPIESDELNRMLKKWINN